MASFVSVGIVFRVLVMSVYLAVVATPDSDQRRDGGKVSSQDIVPSLLLTVPAEFLVDRHGVSRGCLERPEGPLSPPGEPVGPLPQLLVHPPGDVPHGAPFAGSQGRLAHPSPFPVEELVS